MWCWCWCWRWYLWWWWCWCWCWYAWCWCWWWWTCMHLELSGRPEIKVGRMKKPPLVHKSNEDHLELMKKVLTKIISTYLHLSESLRGLVPVWRSPPSSFAIWRYPVTWMQGTRCRVLHVMEKITSYCTGYVGAFVALQLLSRPNQYNTKKTNYSNQTRRRTTTTTTTITTKTTTRPFDSVVCY